MLSGIVGGNRTNTTSATRQLRHKRSSRHVLKLRRLLLLLLYYTSRLIVSIPVVIAGGIHGLLLIGHWRGCVRRRLVSKAGWSGRSGRLLLLLLLLGLDLTIAANTNTSKLLYLRGVDHLCGSVRRVVELLSSVCLLIWLLLWLWLIGIGGLVVGYELLAVLCSDHANGRASWMRLILVGRWSLLLLKS